MTESVNLKEACSFLLEHDDYLILTHKNPDGDTLGCAYALCEALQSKGKKAGVACPDEIPEKYSYFIDGVSNNQSQEPGTVIAVDVADRKLLGKLYETYGDRVELSIDHHQTNTGFAKRTFVNPGAAACCENIYNIIRALGITLTDNMARALYTGISTDTGCFRFSNTTCDTHLIAAELMKYDINAGEINRIMFETKSRTRVELERIVLDNIEFYFNGLCSLIAVTRDIYKKTGCKDDDLEGITSLSRSIEGVVVGITLREREDGKFKASVRTYAPVDAAALCAKMGGGGHVRAAGCEIEGGLAKAKKLIIKNVKQSLCESGLL